jgi:hypothetical protein
MRVGMNVRLDVPINAIFGMPVGGRPCEEVELARFSLCVIA